MKGTDNWNGWAFKPKLSEEHGLGFVIQNVSGLEVFVSAQACHVRHGEKWEVKYSEGSAYADKKSDPYNFCQGKPTKSGCLAAEPAKGPYASPSQIDDLLHLRDNLLELDGNGKMLDNFDIVIEALAYFNKHPYVSVPEFLDGVVLKVPLSGLNMN